MHVALVRFFSDREKVGHFNALFDVTLDASAIAFSKISQWNLRGENIEEKVTDLNRRVVKENPDFVHIDWFHDFETEAVNVAELLELAGIDWTTTGSVSHVERSINSNDLLKQTFLELEKFRRLKGIFIWDLYLAKSNPSGYPKLLPLVDWQDVTVSGTLQDCCKWKSRQRLPVLGLVGQLHPYRGVSLILRFWMTKPKFPVYLAGKYFSTSYSKLEQYLIKVGRLIGRIFLNPEWQDSDSELNHHLLHLDALIIDTKSYPQPSGIVTRARHFGIPVLIPNADSFLNDCAVEDLGISVIDFASTRGDTLLKILGELKTFPAVPSPTRTDSINSFLIGWERQE
jgi:hypothetical protein